MDDPIEQPKVEFSEPQHQDYQRLLAIITTLDARASEEGFNLRDDLAGLVEFQSISYIALERVIASLGVQSPVEMQQRLAEASRLAMLWIEGFHAGAIWERSPK